MSKSGAWKLSPEGQLAIESYIKDLEDMLQRFIKDYSALDHCRFSITDLVREGHADGCVLGQAKTLLERTPVRH